VCGGCEAELKRALADVLWLAAELDTTLAKQGSKATGGRSASIPLPYDPRATEAAAVLRSALVGWVRVLAEDVADAAVPYGPTCEQCQHPSCRWILWLPGPAADTMPAMARWLLAGAERLVMHAAADEAVGEICSAVRSAIRLIDLRAERGFAGPCHAIVDGRVCGASLYARADAAKVRCRQCGAEYEVGERHEWMLASREDKLLPAALAAHALTSLGWPVTGERIRQWAHRHRILAAGTDAQGKALYRVREIRQLLVEGRERMAV
jgi:hypothetical protein